MSRTRIAALYARVSTDEQAREGESLNTQITRLRHYAASRGFENVEVFRDEGYSAKDLNRPALMRLITLIEWGEVEAVCTVAIDRLSRNLLDMLRFIELCERHDTAFVCTAINFDTSTPIGRMTLQMLAAFAEFERSMIATRVRSTMNEIVRQRGRHLSSPPFGYRFGSSGELEVVESEAQWVRKVASLYLSGYGFRWIARWLNTSGAPPTRRGNQWSPSSVRAMLSNRIYTGTVVWGKRCTDLQGRVVTRNESEWIVAPGAHAPIIDPTTYEMISRRAQSVRDRGGIHRAHSRLAGLLRCGHCNGSMVSRRYSSKGQNRNQRIYVCSTYQKKGGCWFNYMPMDDLDEEVRRCLSTICPDLEEPVKTSASAMHGLSADIDRRLRRAIEAYEEGVLTTADLARERNRLEAQRSRTTLRVPQGQSASAPEQSAHVCLSWLWNEAPISTLQRFLRLVIDCCVVTDRQLTEVRLSALLLPPKRKEDSL